MKRTTLLLTFLAFLLLAMPAIASAQEGADDIITGDITQMGEPLAIPATQTVNGDVVVMGAPVAVDGTINGDLVVFGSAVSVGDTAVITGDCVIVGGSISGQSPTACQIVLNEMDWVDQLNQSFSDWTPSVPFAPPVPSIPAVPTIPSLPASPDMPVIPEMSGGRWENDTWIPDGTETSGHGRDWEQSHDDYDNYDDYKPSFLARVSGAAGGALFMGFLAFAVASFAPEHLAQVQSTARRKTAASGAVGFLTSIAVPSVMGIVALISAPLLLACGLGLIGAPILLALGFGLVLGAGLGWVAIGSLFGEWLGNRFNWKMGTSRAQTVLGTIFLSFGLGFLGALPLVPDSLLRLPLFWIGLGAVALTQFGRTSYPRGEGEPVVNPEKIDIVLQTMPEDWA